MAKKRAKKTVGRKVKVKRISIGTTKIRTLAGGGARTKKTSIPKRAPKKETPVALSTKEKAKQINAEIYHKLWRIDESGLEIAYWHVEPHELAKETVKTALKRLRDRIDELADETNDEKRAYDTESCENSISGLEEIKLGDDFPIVLIDFDPGYKDVNDDLRLAKLRQRLLKNETWAARLDAAQAAVDARKD